MNTIPGNSNPTKASDSKKDTIPTINIEHVKDCVIKDVNQDSINTH